MKKTIIFLTGLILFSISVYGLPPLVSPRDGDVPLNGGEKDNDYTTYYDAGNILCFVTNTGSIATDRTSYFGKSDGFYYPKGTELTVVYAAGLILGGKVNGEIRTALATYQDEYVPGPMAGGGPQPNNPSFRVYKIDGTSGPGDPDYDEWPIADGAPVDENGEPWCPGGQTLWAVYNDAGPHTNSGYGGGTEPLGVEIQQTAWGWPVPGNETTMGLEYKLYNKGSNIIDSFYISFWVDPDLGGSTDDFVGCDTAHDIFFCYNATNNDNSYGSIPPAWGGVVMTGPIVPSPGDIAYFDGNPIPDYKNIGMTSFNKYINGIDPDIPEQMYGYMQGFDAMAQCPTCPYIDPNTGDTTKFPLAGDPITGTGWLDSNPADRRLMVSFGPLTFNPGDSQYVFIVLGAAADSDRLTSLCSLKDLLDSACTGDPTFEPAYSVETIIRDNDGLRDVYFDGEPRWLSWVNWGAAYWNGSVDYGINFWGGYLDPNTMPDSFSTVELRFTDNDPSAGQRAYNYLRGGTPNYGYQGYFQVPFEAWDIDNNRQLNAIFIEWTDSDVYDSTWGPDNSDVGGREYLYIMNSDYDGDNPSDAGTGAIDYVNGDFYDGSEFDFLYAGWFRLRGGYSLDDMEVGHKLVFDYASSINPDSLADSIIFKTIETGDTTYQLLDIICYSPGRSLIELEISDPDKFYTEPELFDLFNGQSEMVRIYFTPMSNGPQSASLMVKDGIFGHTLGVMKLVGDATGDQIDEMYMLPEPVYALYQFSTDTMLAEIYIPQSITEYSIYDIDTATVTVNGSITPESCEFITDETTGHEFIKISIDIAEFIAAYPLLWDLSEQEYTVTGSLTTGGDFAETDQVTMFGHRSGDINADDVVNLLDMTYYINYIYKSGPEPKPVVEAGDINGDDSISILDITFLLSYLYKGGPAPFHK